jgi:glycogen(starch) synthase
MKIVIASHDFLPNIGGVATTVSILAHGFRDAGHDVTVVTISPGPTKGYGYSVIRNPPAWRLCTLYAGADILVLSNLAIRLIYPLVVFRRPFALQHHSESAFQLCRSPFSLDLLRRSVMGRAKHFMTSAYIGSKSGLKEYVVTSPFANPHYMTQDMLVPLDQRSGALFAGRLEPEKGVLFLLDRWLQISDILKVSEVRIAGDGSLRPEVERRISDGLRGVTYLGPLSIDKMAREMAYSAFVLVPSLWEEPFGAVALEAVAAGALVVVSNRGGLAEATGDLGFVFDPDDPASFRQALQAARKAFDCQLGDPKQRAVRETAIAKHVARFSPAVVVEKIISAFTD